MGCGESKENEVSRTQSKSKNSGEHSEEKLSNKSKFKILLLGPPSVGKSSLLYKFTEGKNLQDVDGEIREKEWREKELEVLGKKNYPSTF